MASGVAGQSKVTSLQSQIYLARQKTQEFNKSLLSARKEEEASLRTFEDDRVKWTQSFEEKNVMIEQLQRELEATVNALHSERSISHTPIKYAAPLPREDSLSFNRDYSTPRRIAHHYTDFDRPHADTNDLPEAPRRSAPPAPEASVTPAEVHDLSQPSRLSTSSSCDLLQLKHENEELKSELDTMKKAWRESETHLKHRVSEVKELNLLLESSHAIEADLRARINTFEKLHETASVNIKTLRCQLEQQAIENSVIRDKMEAISQDVAQRDRYIATLESEMERLKAALADSEAAREAMAAQDIEYASQLERAQQAVVMLSRRLSEDSTSDSEHEKSLRENDFYVDDDDDDEEEDGRHEDVQASENIHEQDDDEDVMTQLEEGDDSDEDFKGTSLLVSLPPQASPRTAPSSAKPESTDDVEYGSESLQEALRTEEELQKWIDELKVPPEKPSSSRVNNNSDATSTVKVTQHFQTPAGGTISSIDTATVSSVDRVSVGSAADDIRQLQQLSPPVASLKSEIVKNTEPISEISAMKGKADKAAAEIQPTPSRMTRKNAHPSPIDKRQPIPKKKIVRAKSHESTTTSSANILGSDRKHDDPNLGTATRSILDFTVSSPTKMFVRQNASSADTTNATQSKSRSSTRVSMERAAHEFLSQGEKSAEQSATDPSQSAGHNQAIPQMQFSGDIATGTKTLKVRVPSASGRATRMRKHAPPSQSPIVSKASKPLKRSRAARDSNILGSNLREVKGYVLADKMTKSGKDVRTSIESDHANDISNISLSSDNHKSAKAKKDSVRGAKTTTRLATRSTSAPPRTSVKQPTPQRKPKTTSRVPKYSISPKSTLLLATSSSRGASR